MEPNGNTMFNQPTRILDDINFDREIDIIDVVMITQIHASVAVH